QMMIPQPIGKVFSNTRLLVSHASKGKQNPVEWSSINESYSLLAGAPQKMKSTGSIVITSQITGNLYIENIEMASVEPNSVIPLNNMEAGSYNLKISGEESWEEVVLVLENQITNVSADGTPADPGNIMVDNRDMYKYTIKVFGSKTWMTANASYEVPVESYCYDNDAANCDVLGRLYTWEAAQNVCPDGWHLPSDVEWMALEKFIGMKEKETMKMGLRGVSAGNLLKDNTLNLWTSPEEANSRTNGFNALPGGYSLNKTTFLGIDKSAIFWTSTEQRGSSAYYRKIEDSKGGIHRYYSEKSTAYAVRCVKD
ncbi:MAG: hypothetical protein GY790_00515, partial [Bacteroidetes bacterium]|nr:hypothetical protein [Bacteroidota bacterium]